MTTLHENNLSDATKDMQRALDSLREELEAIGWYSQRIEACTDDELKKILTHAMDEEKEHAAMLLNWIISKDDKFASKFAQSTEEKLKGLTVVED